ncbi:acyl-CoA dehydrogenase [Streptomyces sp. NPDC087917]|uniref:acyl-CoA dehydrogenase n=1 Tax=Streptomyces sp. NPDC087917 TaxID=3155060 RepID=UPI0034423D20
MQATAYEDRSSTQTGTPAHAAWMAEVRLEVAADFTRYVERIASGAFDCPLPGAGRTAARFSALAAVAERDLSLVRLVEGHVDALAILAELGAPAPGPAERWAVWAAEPRGEGLTASRSPEGWVLNGLKQYCSGAHSCTHALVTATAEDGRRLFAVATGESEEGPGPRVGCRAVDGSWQALGMAASDSASVVFTDVPALPVGAVGAYLERPGFQHGGIGVAACWYGGARAVAELLADAAAQRGPDPITDAHLGAVTMRLDAAASVLHQAADEIDRDPTDTHGTARRRSLRVRAFVESVCSDVLAHVGRATGAEPLCHNPVHTRRATDLGVYLRQHHGDRNLAELGRLVAEARLR